LDEGGFQVDYPDIAGCMSDGEKALRDCLEVFAESGRKMPIRD